MSSSRSPADEEQKELTNSPENVSGGDVIISNNEIEMLESLLDTEQESEIDDSDDDPTYEVQTDDNLTKRSLLAPRCDEEQCSSSFDSMTTEDNSYKKHTRLLKVCSCRLKCYEKVHLFNRQVILNNFKSYDFAQRRMFLDKYIIETKVKRRTNQTINQMRNRTLIYTFPNIDPNENNVIVCKKMFLTTLGTRSDGIITSHLKSKQVKKIVDLEDKRALATNQKRKRNMAEIDARILAHIESFNPVASHYKLMHAPNRRYLPQDINVRFLHKDFCSVTSEKIGYDKYRKIFVKQNIGITVPSEDKCPLCSTYEQHCIENNIVPASSSTIIENAIGIPSTSSAIIDEGMREIEPVVRDEFQPSTTVLSCSRTAIQSTDNQNTETGSILVHIENDCLTCQRYKLHKINYIDARKAYTSDTGNEHPPNCNIFTADMQKIFTVPKMTIKNSYFVSRLIVMNETFAPLHKGKIYVYFGMKEFGVVMPLMSLQLIIKL